MPRFKPGDRVQLTGEVAQFYGCVIGVVSELNTNYSRVLVQCVVRLADGTASQFFDFQLQPLTPVWGRIVLDNQDPEGRLLRLVAADVNIQVKIAGVLSKSILVQVLSGEAAASLALVTLLKDDQPIFTKSTDE